MDCEKMCWKNCFIGGLILLFTIISPLTAGDITILEESATSMTIEITVDTLLQSSISLNNDIYDIISVNNFGKNCADGRPAMPYRGMSIATGSSELTITVLESSFITLPQILLAPDQGADIIAPNDHLLEHPFLIDESFYATNELYPAEPVSVMRSGNVQGTNIVTLAISPVQYNPVQQSLKLYKRLVVKVEYNHPQVRSVSELSSKVLRNIAVNSLQINGSRSAEVSQGVLIIAKDTYSEGAETLAEWQNQKGYDVTIDSRNSWSTSDVQSAINSWYAIDSIDASYLLFIGDIEDIPPHGMLTKTATSTYSSPTDHYYTCLEGDDYYGDLARGRIPVSTAEEAMNAVNKIIRFEKYPSHNETYYNTTLGAAYLQDNGRNEWWPENDMGFADRRFAQTIEEINLYLESKGYEFERVFNTNAVEVNKWNLGKYSWGEPVPDYLKPPLFNWDGETEDIMATLNSGAFLAYHYDHGYEDGWADPSFTVNDIPSLTNDSILPIIYSINCLTGKFNHPTKSFAERMLSEDGHGAVGIVAATNLSYSGWNEALLLGMIDATWPGISLSTPNTEDPVVTVHEPVYKLGDIMNQGLLRMTETWTNTYDEDLDEYHFQLYHYFGDPTTRIWTQMPAVLTPSHSSTINPSDNDFYLSNLNVSEGMVTLYNKNSGETIGRSSATNNETIIGISQTLVVGDTITLTVTGQDVRPYLADIIVSDIATSVTAPLRSEGMGVQIRNNLLHLSNISVGGLEVKVFDLRGREIQHLNIERITSEVINLNDLGIARGSYLVTVHSSDIDMVTRIVIDE